MRLTDIAIKNLKPPEKGQRDYRDDSIPGFICRVSQAGSKTFYLMHGTDRRRTALGKYPELSLKMARSEAQRLLAEHTLGKHQAPRQTVLSALEAFLAFHSANNRASTTSEVRRILTKQFTALHRKQLGDVTTHDITRITDRMIADGHPSAATHAHMAVRNFLAWCVRRRYLDHSPLEGLERPAQSSSRERVLSDDELRAVWKASDDCGQFGTIVKLLIVTGQRRSEVGSLRSEWLDLDKRTWTTPSNFTKNKRSHTFPLSSMATALIVQHIGSGQHQNPDQFLFPARGATNKPFSGWSKAKAQLDRKIIEFRQKDDKLYKLVPWTLHDLRRTLATNWQRQGISTECIEAYLNHVSGVRAGIVGVYQKHKFWDEMVAAVRKYEVWLQYVVE